MKKRNFLKSSASGLLVILLLSFIGLEVFQGQKAPLPYNEAMFDYDESDPYIDRPTREALTHVTEAGDDDLDILTDANGFDNFEIGVDFAEQMLVSNPRNPLNMQFGVNNSVSGQNAYYTTDGYNWTQSNPAYNPSICCDPWSAWDSTGNLFYGSGVSGQYVYKSTNGGATYGAGVLSVNGNDRNTLAADQTNGPYKNYLYAAITPGNFARSTNGGTTWAQTYTSSNTIPGTMIAVGPNGATQGGCVMYVTNTGSTANVTYTFHRSLDGGATFAVRSSLTVAGYVGTLNTAGRLVINNGRTRPYPMIAMDNSYGPNRGRLYLVYASNSPAGNGNKPDVFCRYSTDGGANWSTEVTVNDDANTASNNQWHPAMWVDKETGRLYVQWMDTRDCPTSDSALIYATYSTNGGQSFVQNQMVSNKKFRINCTQCNGGAPAYLGDYNSIVSNKKASMVAWADFRNNNFGSYTAYFPDFALRTSATNISINSSNFTTFRAVVPSVKLYADTVVFSATVTPAPASGSLTAVFPNGNILRNYPDSLIVRINAAPGTTSGNYTVTLLAKGPNGTPVHRRTVALNVGLVGISNVSGTPDEFSLSQNFPNPFNPTTSIRFDIKKSANVTLKVYNSQGQEVATLINNEVVSAGTQEVTFGANNLSSGIYFYTLSAGDFRETKKMMLIK